MQEDLIASLGEELHRALAARTPVVPLSSRGHGLTIEHATASSSGSLPIASARVTASSARRSA